MHAYQQNENVDAGEDVLVDFMTDGAVNHILFRHGDPVTLASAHVYPMHGGREPFGHAGNNRHNQNPPGADVSDQDSCRRRNLLICLGNSFKDWTHIYSRVFLVG